ncbi:MAG TPA: hypothetical protein VFB48_02335 [Nitrososphaeraceae archaeon]|nr:hypothetical protein [Nitrososphaeraceae archaeon]
MFHSYIQTERRTEDSVPFLTFVLTQSTYTLFSIIFRQQMLNTKYVLMFVVLSAGLLTALTATGMSQTQTAFAHEYKKKEKERICEDNNNNNCNDVKQKLYQENYCKIKNENSNERHSDKNDNHISTGDQELNCWNYAQNAGQDATAQDDAFSGPSD